MLLKLVVALGAAFVATIMYKYVAQYVEQIISML
jgi:hypothetical protein